MARFSVGNIVQGARDAIAPLTGAIAGAVAVLPEVGAIFSSALPAAATASVAATQFASEAAVGGALVNTLGATAATTAAAAGNALSGALPAIAALGIPATALALPPAAVAAIGAGLAAVGVLGGGLIGKAVKSALQRDEVQPLETDLAVTVASDSLAKEMQSLQAAHAHAM